MFNNYLQVDIVEVEKNNKLEKHYTIIGVILILIIFLINCKFIRILELSHFIVACDNLSDLYQS